MILNVKKREAQGSNASQKLRSSGQCPAVVYGPKCKPVHISVDSAEFEQLLRGFKPSLHPFKVDVEGKKHEVLLKTYDATYDGQILHADFYAIAKGSKVHVAVPLLFEHEDQCVGKKVGGVMDHHITEIEVEVMPKDIPDAIAVDVAALEIGKSIHLSEIKLPKGLSLLTPIDENHDPILVSCEAPRVESEPEVEESVEEPAEDADAEAQEEQPSEESDQEQGA